MYMFFLGLLTICTVIQMIVGLWDFVESRRLGRHHDHLIPHTPRAPRG